LAQDKVDPSTTQELKKQDTVPPATSPKRSEQAGTQEPSSKVQGTSTIADVLVNGMLTAPGAPTDVQTTPAKFSARAAADDQLPIAAYRLRHLTDDQRREIYQQLSSETGAVFRPAAANDEDRPIVGALVSADVALNKLSPIPKALAAKFSELRDATFTGSAGGLLLVDPVNRLVIGVLSAQ